MIDNDTYLFFGDFFFNRGFPVVVTSVSPPVIRGEKISREMAKSEGPAKKI